MSPSDPIKRSEVNMSRRPRGDVDPTILTFRSATFADLGSVLSWLPDAQSFLMWAGPKVRYSTDVAAVWSDIHASADNTFGVYIKKGGIVGFGQLFLQGRDCVHFARLIVDPVNRRRGVGRFLCRRLMQAAERHAAREFTLNVYAQNKAAVSLYRSLGFNARHLQGQEDVLFMHRMTQTDR